MMIPDASACKAPHWGADKVAGKERRVLPGAQDASQSRPHDDFAGVGARALHETHACASVRERRQPSPCRACSHQRGAK